MSVTPREETPMTADERETCLKAWRRYCKTLRWNDSRQAMCAQFAAEDTRERATALARARAAKATPEPTPAPKAAVVTPAAPTRQPFTERLAAWRKRKEGSRATA